MGAGRGEGETDKGLHSERGSGARGGAGAAQPG